MTNLEMFILYLLILIHRNFLEGIAVPENYYDFEQRADNFQPPKVRKPPYLQTNIPCPGMTLQENRNNGFLNSLCGDLNTGFLPLNPLKRTETYPFELIKNKTLEFFTRTLNVLKYEKNLPKVMLVKKEETPIKDAINSNSTFHVQENDHSELFKKNTFTEKRFQKRSILSDDNKEDRQIFPFCDNGAGILCRVYSLLAGKGTNREKFSERNFISGSSNKYMDFIEESSLTATPCPSSIEYITPVFARNNQGLWRYVVQIPQEGYFTQTVEVTRCLSTSCHFMKGLCSTSPRWISFLVAEVFYPHSVLPETFYKIPVDQLSENITDSTYHGIEAYCDGHDEFGCFQVQLYFDWFLVSGACKCWKQSYRDILSMK